MVYLFCFVTRWSNYIVNLFSQILSSVLKPKRKCLLFWLTANYLYLSCAKDCTNNIITKQKKQRNKTHHFVRYASFTWHFISNVFVCVRVRVRLEVLLYNKCVCKQLRVGVSPHRVCMSGAQPPLWRGPWGRCDSAEGSPCDVLVSTCVVCRLERFARYLGRRKGGGRGEGGRHEAALVSSLSSLANGAGGDKAHPFPPLPIGAIIHIILANQKTSNKVTPQMDVTAYGTPTTTQLPD